MPRRAPAPFSAFGSLAGTADWLRRGWVSLASAAVVALRWPFAQWLGWEPPDPWRRTLGLGLRSEATMFGLSAFGLDVFSDAPPHTLAGRGFAAGESHFVRRLAAFLARAPEARWALDHHRHFVARRAIAQLDAVHCRFDADGCLQSVHLLEQPGRAGALSKAQARVVEAAVLEAHQATRQMSETCRPLELLRHVLLRLDREPIAALRSELQAHARRLLAAGCVSCEPMPEEQGKRFALPDFKRHRGLGWGFLNAVVRLSADGTEADLWLQIHHTGADGAPMQEMLTRLEREWGGQRPVRFPPDDAGRRPSIRPLQSATVDRPLSLLVDFIDFTPLVNWRRRVNERLRALAIEPLPLSAAFLWWLARQPEFSGRTLATAMDVPGDGRRERAVDLAPIRPGAYAQTPEGLAAFARDYARLVAESRRRASRSFAAMRALALLPAPLAACALKVNQARTRATFGTVGLSMLKDARVFVAPMADHGWDEGFIAIGNANLPTAAGGVVTAVTVKGEAELLQRYPAAIRRAIAASGADSVQS